MLLSGEILGWILQMEVASPPKNKTGRSRKESLLKAYEWENLDLWNSPQIEGVSCDASHFWFLAFLTVAAIQHSNVQQQLSWYLNPHLRVQHLDGRWTHLVCVRSLEENPPSCGVANRENSTLRKTQITKTESIQKYCKNKIKQNERCC